MNLVGKRIRITNLKDDPAADSYTGKTGTILRTDKDCYGETQYWGTWGGIALYDGEFEVVDKFNKGLN